MRIVVIFTFFFFFFPHFSHFSHFSRFSRFSSFGVFRAFSRFSCFSHFRVFRVFRVSSGYTETRKAFPQQKTAPASISGGKSYNQATKVIKKEKILVANNLATS